MFAAIAAMAVPAATATAAVANGLPSATLFNPFNIFGISPISFGINPPINPISPVINPPNPVPNAINAAKSPGQVFFKNTAIASSFPLFSGSESQSTIFSKVLPKKTFQIKSHILSHRLLTGFNILSTTPPSFLKGFFSNLSSCFFLFLSSSFLLS